MSLNKEHNHIWIDARNPVNTSGYYCECGALSLDGKNPIVKQDTTDWEEEFEYMERNHGWIPEHKEAIKSFISQVRQKAQQEVVEILKKKLNELPRYGSSQHTIPANFWCYSQDDIDKLAESLLSNQ